MAIRAKRPSPSRRRISLSNRGELKRHNKSLADAAHAGRFTDAKRKHTATRAEAKETTEKAGNRIISLRISTCANFAHTEVELSKGSVVANFATTHRDLFPKRKQLKKQFLA